MALNKRYSTKISVSVTKTQHIWCLFYHEGRTVAQQRSCFRAIFAAENCLDRFTFTAGPLLEGTKEQILDQLGFVLMACWEYFPVSFFPLRTEGFSVLEAEVLIMFWSYKSHLTQVCERRSSVVWHQPDVDPAAPQGLDLVGPWCRTYWTSPASLAMA